MSPAGLANAFEVLVVDDEPGARELLYEFFESRGFTVAAAQDGRAAIAMLQRSNGCYGLVITDLSLPGDDGFAVLQAAQQANPSSYVVIVTGYASLDSAINAVRVGAYDYLTKPFSLSQLEIILERIHDRMLLQEASRRLQSGRAGADYPDRTGAVTPDLDQRVATIEQRLTSIEQALARIEQVLAARRETSARPGRVGAPTRHHPISSGKPHLCTAAGPGTALALAVGGTLTVDTITDSAIVAALGRQLNRAVARQQVAASNIANIDTPGYRAKEVQFAEALDASLNGPSTDAPIVTDAEGVAARRDGNTVQMDRELLNLTRAAGEFSAAQTALAAKFRLVRYAINEGR